MQSDDQLTGPNHLGGSLVFARGDEYLDDAEDNEEGVMEDAHPGEGIMEEEIADLCKVTSQGPAHGQPLITVL